MRYWWFLAGMLLVLSSFASSTSNSNAPAADPVLEARAKAGDVSPAYMLVANDLRQCQDCRNIWLLNGGERPPCLADAVPQPHEAYLSDAVDGMPAGSSKEGGEDLVARVGQIQALYRIDKSRDQIASEQIDAIVRMCPQIEAHQ